MDDMRDLEELEILKGIVHILDNKNNDKVLTDFELDMNEKIEKLLKSHIKVSIQDEKTRVAKFDITIENPIKNICTKILNNDEDFIKDSKIIAEYLYRAMKTRPSVAPANFAICLYTANEEKYLALLKMDFSEVIETKRIVVENKLKIALEIKDTGVPNGKQKLRKCVFIKSYSTDNEYDLILLDKDKKDEGIADFFATTFLNSNLANTSTSSTKNIIKETEKFINEIYKNDVGEARHKRKMFFDILAEHQEMDVKILSDSMFDDQNIKEAYLKRISKNVGDYTFQIDKSFIREKLNKKMIRTNTGVDINLTNNIYDDPDKFEIIVKDDRPEVDILIKNVTYTESSIK